MATLKHHLGTSNVVYARLIEDPIIGLKELSTINQHLNWNLLKFDTFRTTRLQTFVTSDPDETSRDTSNVVCARSDSNTAHPESGHIWTYLDPICS